ncbi:MAG TPA: hypothetical protein VMU21_07530 [Thermodesulfovibrionales bacterium]|nr:hypothetical protein [Thermodesulfovibrionales bacterium]
MKKPPSAQSPSVPDTKNFENPKAEEVRLRALYRNIVLRGDVRLPIKAMKALIGPDCAFHLYRSSHRTKRD